MRIIDPAQNDVSCNFPVVNIVQRQQRVRCTEHESQLEYWETCALTTQSGPCCFEIEILAQNKTAQSIEINRTSMGCIRPLSTMLSPTQCPVRVTTAAVWGTTLSHVLPSQTTSFVKGKSSRNVGFDSFFYKQRPSISNNVRYRINNITPIVHLAGNPETSKFEQIPGQFWTLPSWTQTHAGDLCKEKKTK